MKPEYRRDRQNRHGEWIPGMWYANPDAARPPVYFGMENGPVRLVRRYVTDPEIIE